MPIPDGEIGQAIFKKYFPTEEWEESYISETADLKSISDYARLSFIEVLNLPYSLFLLYRKDAWLNGLKQDEKGREFLENLWRLQQTKADENAINRFRSGKEGGK
ncbi:hypothetical protein ACSXAE_07180 [Clostridium perfringens]|uniref:hypothetical protein n=1 Tax=Clostridium perfringens TaxID=1502 RepID=UPI001F058D57|nr:hypothetical protein [Clostridium perfringens]MCH1962807.1 hypothetical protein [Clostridium perfringens]